MAEVIADCAGQHPGRPLPQSGIAEIWQVALDAIPSGDRLGAADRGDVAGFADKAATRLALRSVLGRYLGPGAASRPIAVSTHGRPFLPGAQLDFNTARRGRTVLIAITGEGAVGIDLEDCRPLPEREGIERMLHPLERDALAQLHGPARDAAFFRVWTRKEAALKASGLGLSFGLDRFSVLEERCAIGRRALWLRDLRVGDDLAAAIASDLPLSRLRRLRFPGGLDATGGCA